jgi:two-component system, NtrC family, nitrogen regulation sensor histidine kinase NtrY
LLWTGDFLPGTRWTLAAAVLLAWLGIAAALREHVVHPLNTLANMLAALREGDYSMRARNALPRDALGLVHFELNALGRMLREQRLGMMEATALLRTVMEEIEVSVFTFDGERRLKLVNRAGERLLARPATRLLGRTAEELGLGVCLEHDTPRVVDAAFPGAMGRWEVRRGQFRQSGRPHELLVLTDLSRTLREEERAAWQRLIRVIGHEVNNSLTPIHSIADTLSALLRRESLHDTRDDLAEGLEVISTRSAALARFMAQYARLARLPPPVPGEIEVRDWVARTVAMEQRVSTRIDEGPDVTILADGDQLDQLLINLLRNAADAAVETGGAVRIRWTLESGRFELSILDEGPGIASSANLFVPFYTTKPGGSGIGLVLSRQIAEAHGGTLILDNRTDARGCEARVVLPPDRVLHGGSSGAPLLHRSSQDERFANDPRAGGS